MRALTISCAFLVGGCLFNGDETRGLPCDNDDQCGRNDSCDQGICGGPSAASSIGDGNDDGADGNDSSGDGNDDGGNESSGGGGCSITPECASSSSLRGCVGDEEVVLSCSEICDTEALACEFSSDSGNDVCYCAPDLGACTSVGDRMCSGGNLLQCGTDSRWDLFDCDGECRAIGRNVSSCGVDPPSGQTACLCSTGTCLEGAAYCVDSQTLGGCLNGLFQTFSCTEICSANNAGPPLGCAADSSGEGCFCAN